MRAELTYMLGAGKGAYRQHELDAGPRRRRNCAPYVASKHAIIGITKAAALDYAKAGIRINAVCPGPVRTHMADVFLQGNEALFEEVRAAMPIDRFIETDEVAAAAVWLC